MLIVNLYAPNGPKSEFFKNIYRKIAKYNSECIVLMGDFNGTVSNSIGQHQYQKEN